MCIHQTSPEVKLCCAPYNMVVPDIQLMAHKIIRNIARHVWSWICPHYRQTAYRPYKVTLAECRLQAL